MKIDGIDTLHIERYTYEKLLKAEALNHDKYLQLAIFKAMDEPQDKKLFKHFYKDSCKNYQKTKDFVDSMTTGPIARFPETKEQKKMKLEMISSMALIKCREEGRQWLEKSAAQGLAEAQKLLEELKK